MEHRFALEDTSTSPVKTHVGADSLDRIRIMLKTCMDEVRKHDVELGRLRVAMSAGEAAKREETLKALLLDAARKAEATRAVERVGRIGMILASSSIKLESVDADEVEEMMRIAMNLSDVEVLILKAAIQQHDREATSKAEARNSLAARAWMAVAANHTTSISGDELASIGAKLQSFGLTSRIEGLTGDTSSFVVLERGRRFIKYIRNSISNSTRNAERHSS